MEDALAHGRTRQKQRTRDALVTAARSLIAEGTSPTVEDAATASGISRTTAYRYFKNQQELLAAVHPETQQTSLLPVQAPDAPDARLEIVVKAITRNVVQHEETYRTMLRLSLDPATPKENLVLRQGRAIGWIEDALAPLRQSRPDVDVHRLAVADRKSVV